MNSKLFQRLLLSLLCASLLAVATGCTNETDISTQVSGTARQTRAVTLGITAAERRVTINTPNSISSSAAQSRPTTAVLPSFDSQWQTVKSFAYQLQNIELNQLERSNYDLLILDYSKDGSEETRFTASEINALKTRPGKSPRLVLAYLSIGEAEDYRWYWNNAWDSAKTGIPSTAAPSWLGTSNPDWQGNYKVKYWEPGWQTLLFGTPNSYMDKIIEAGFDGVYLDIIDAYEYWGPDGESGLNRRSAEQEMVNLVEAIAQYGRREKPEFGIFPQNGEALGRYPDYVQTVTGIGREDTWYDGNKANASSEIKGTLADLDLFKQAGKLVLATDYITSRPLIDDFYTKAQAKGFLAYATTRDLDQLTINSGHEP
ncbi:MAG: endo alpha-1,4 polygalactosaminidase [Chloroflexi bacterium]|uniref:Endo alpha-1,4 polygalactosaminidase n=1 Tax=Candidatus Chlorohelix allophototropha TaxID=3003348 RepID=A0A8T7M742_9CHLR|nr:endo alpha-1,4 polygalactosaminidase [Chloroflexota bacterium]WJW69872.1 endo alpha-1,4 polygalactosaminidase [Chloroflexota bacterium L227-S17]